MTKNDRKTENGSRVPAWPRFTWRPRLMMEQRYQRRLLLLLLALVLMAIVIPKGSFIPDYYAPGDIASRDIKAPKDLLVPDLPLTEKKRAEAEDAVRAALPREVRRVRRAGRKARTARRVRAGRGRRPCRAHRDGPRVPGRSAVPPCGRCRAPGSAR